MNLTDEERKALVEYRILEHLISTLTQSGYQNQD